MEILRVNVHADISQFRILAHMFFLVVTMLFVLLTFIKHIDDHDAVINAVNSSDFQADSVTDTFNSPNKTDEKQRCFV